MRPERVADSSVPLLCPTSYTERNLCRISKRCNLYLFNETLEVNFKLRNSDCTSDSYMHSPLLFYNLFQWRELSFIISGVKINFFTTILVNMNAIKKSPRSTHYLWCWSLRYICASAGRERKVNDMSIQGISKLVQFNKRLFTTS